MNSKKLIKNSLIVLVILFVTSPLQGQTANEKNLLNRLIPQPVSARLDDSHGVILDKSLNVSIELAIVDAKDKKKATAMFKQYFGTMPNINIVQKDNTPQHKEAYRIKADGTTLTIAANNFQGARYAMNTLRQLAEANSGTEKLVSYRIPKVEIEDAPVMDFRGLHLCWFPETDPIQIEQTLRWASYFKFNTVVIEFWGVYPFKSYPYLSWKEYKLSTKSIKHIVELSKELGLTLIPQFNIFGHAAGSRATSGKHSVLDFHPEYQPLFEPSGWTWCLSNPVTRTMLTQIVNELLDAFENPPYFHVGCDEAGIGECHACRNTDYKSLLVDHLHYFHQLLAKRNCRMMMWHDMLLAPEERWKGYKCNGHYNENDFLLRLPKDIIICDWQYDKPQKDETWPTMRYFKELGFDVLACPWNEVQGILSQAETVKEAHLSGMLCTTWQSPFLGKNEMQNILYNSAQATWSKPPYVAINGYTVFEKLPHIRQINSDIPVKKYRHTGVHQYQVNPTTYPIW